MHKLWFEYHKETGELLAIRSGYPTREAAIDAMWEYAHPKERTQPWVQASTPAKKSWQVRWYVPQRHWKFAVQRMVNAARERMMKEHRKWEVRYIGNSPVMSGIVTVKTSHGEERNLREFEQDQVTCDCPHYVDQMGYLPGGECKHTLWYKEVYLPSQTFPDAVILENARGFRTAVLNRLHHKEKAWNEKGSVRSSAQV